jgi:hypothetical protein
MNTDGHGPQGYAHNLTQRLGAAEPQPSSEDPFNRRDAESAEKDQTKHNSKILLKMRDSTD